MCRDSLGYEVGGAGGRGPNSSVTVTNETGSYTYYQAYYVSDTWQTTHKLTLNLGLRYELPGGAYARHDLNSVLLPNATNPVTGAMGTLSLVNSSLYPDHSAINVKHDLFAPRLGFAYRFLDTTVVRGGYGLSYLPIASLASASPINTATTGCGTTNTVTPLASQLMYNCFSASNPIIQAPSRSADFFETLSYYNNTNNAITGAVPYQTIPYVQQWNLSVGQQFRGDASFEVSYVGSKGTHLPALTAELNELPDSDDHLGATLDTPGTCGTSAQGAALTVGQCLRPYPHYGNVTDSLAFHASTIYHSLQIRGEKRFRTGGLVTGNFTWAKQIGDTDNSTNFLEAQPSNSSFSGGLGAVQDPNNIPAERSVLTHDVPYRAIFSYVLELPFGQGKKFGSSYHGLAGNLISGYAINSITTFQKGFRVPILSSGVRGGPDANLDLFNSFGAGQLRPNCTAGCQKNTTGSVNQRIGEWFNTSCFTNPAPFIFGNEPRVDNNIFAEGIDNFDVSALKRTKIRGEKEVEFRVEAFNLFNRKQFGPPDAQLGDSTFGQILSDANQPRLLQFSLRFNF